MANNQREQTLRDFNVSFDVTQKDFDGSEIHHTKKDVVTKDELTQYVQNLINQWVNSGYSFNLAIVENNTKDL